MKNQGIKSGNDKKNHFKPESRIIAQCFGIGYEQQNPGWDNKPQTPLRPWKQMLC